MASVRWFNVQADLVLFRTLGLSQHTDLDEGSRGVAQESVGLISPWIVGDYGFSPGFIAFIGLALPDCQLCDPMQAV